MQTYDPKKVARVWERVQNHGGMEMLPELTTVSWAYPLTWCCSSIVFGIYLLKADWIHNFDRLEQKKGSIAG